MIMGREKIKMIGFYILLILVFARFVVTPLNNTLKEKKALLNDYSETYKMKTLQIERLKAGKKTPAARTDEAEKGILENVYPRDSSYTLIQSKALRELIGSAEKNGLAVVNFEVPDAITGKNISEAPVIIRLKGPARSAVELLKDIERGNRPLRIRNYETSPTGNEFIFSLTVSAFRMEK